MSKSAPAKLEAFIQKFVPKFMRQGQIPGLSIAIVQDDNVIFTEGFGSRNVEKNLPATPATLYGIGSCTKSFVALVILQLMEKEKLSLNDPITEYLPIEIGGPSITIHHLLTHSSSIPSLGTSLLSLSRGIGAEEPGVPWGGVNDFYRFINGAKDEVTGTPGEKFFYFNAGYRMLGHIIQKVSGMFFHEYITENILKPLKMERTTLSKNQYQNDSNRMIPYWIKPNGKRERTEFPYPEPSNNPNFSFILAAGGIISSVVELTRYLRLNMNMLESREAQILPPHLIEKMQNLYMNRPKKFFGKRGYGYGWEITKDFFGHKLVSHGGSVLVSTAHLAFIPEIRAGVAMAANGKGFPYSTIVHGIFTTLMGKDPEKVLPSLKIKERMKTLTGTYETYKGLNRVKIIKKEGILYLKKKDQFTDVEKPLIPEENTLNSHKFHIFTEGIREPVQFVVQSPDDIDLYIERYRYKKLNTPR